MKYSVKQVSVIIPNWNGVKLLRKNLPSVLVSTKGVREVIVVDDASDDTSVSMLRKEFPTVRVVKRQINEGFSSTVNSGVSKAQGDIVVLLNTDIQPEPNFLPSLLSHFENQQVFAVGCMDKSIEDGNVVLRGRGEAAWRKGFYVHWRGEIDKSDTSWVSCGSGAFRISVWQELGGLDPLYNPFYWEDIDISYRAQKAGYRLIFESKSIVDHLHEEGKILKQYSGNKIRTIAYRNQFIFIWKNLSGFSYWLEHIFWTIIRLFQALTKGDYPMLFGYLRAVFLFPKIIKNRFSLFKK